MKKQTDCAKIQKEAQEVQKIKMNNVWKCPNNVKYNNFQTKRRQEEN